MEYIFHTERLGITLDPRKHRLYCMMRGFWKYDRNCADLGFAIFQQLSRRHDIHTVVLDTSFMMIMHPRMAEHFLPIFTSYLLEAGITALAHIGDPDNTVLRMQFWRVLQDMQKAHEVWYDSFQDPRDAESWLDFVQFSLSTNIHVCLPIHKITQ